MKQSTAPFTRPWPTLFPYFISKSMLHIKCISKSAYNKLQFLSSNFITFFVFFTNFALFLHDKKINLFCSEISLVQVSAFKGMSICCYSTGSSSSTISWSPSTLLPSLLSVLSWISISFYSIKHNFPIMFFKIIVSFFTWSFLEITQFRKTINNTSIF